MKQAKNWVRYLFIKIAQFFGFDLVGENKMLHDRINDLEAKVKELEQLNSKGKEKHLEQEKKPPIRLEKNSRRHSPLFK